jgi:hypothetical protein
MKPIKLSDNIKAKALENFQKLLTEYKGEEGLNIKITAETLLEDFGEIQKPTVYITAAAYVKMRGLIQSSSNELAWHGTVTKVDNNYLIDNIYVYPQTVTASTVDADDDKYAMWLMELEDDVINRLRFQGHSHVTMTASPSGRDTDNWQKFLNLLKDDEFYLFCIGNKHDRFYWNIYDMASNVVFEDKDITMLIIDEQATPIDIWVKENVDKHITNTTTRVSTTGFKNYMAEEKISRYAEGPAYSVVEDTRPGTQRTKHTSLYEDYIPKKLKDEAPMDVGYAMDVDIYYSDCHVPGFWYSNAWGAFIMDGPACRARYGAPIKIPEKEKKSTGKRGRPPKQNKEAKQ